MSAAYMRRCAGKKRFDDKSQAVASKASLRGDTGLKSDRLSVYRCDQCMGYHVGRNRGVFITRNRRSGKRANKRMRGR